MPTWGVTNFNWWAFSSFAGEENVSCPFMCYVGPHHKQNQINLVNTQYKLFDAK
jgi:hypothetical protein